MMFFLVVGARDARVNFGDTSGFLVDNWMTKYRFHDFLIGCPERGAINVLRLLPASTNFFKNYVFSGLKSFYQLKYNFGHLLMHKVETSLQIQVNLYFIIHIL